jgi:hypothetical protein
MAIDVNKVQKAVSQVLSGISDGVEDVGSIVSNVTADFPEKVVFQMEAVTNRDAIERVKLTQIPEKRIITQVGEVTARDEFSLSGVLVETVNYVDSTAYTVEQAIAATESVQKEYEDAAIGVVLEILGPKSS